MVEQMKLKLKFSEDGADRQSEMDERGAVLKRIARGIPAACADECGNAYLKYLDGSRKYVN